MKSKPLHRMTRTERAKILALCSCIGLSVERRKWCPEEAEHPWSGRALHLKYTSGMIVSDLCHDIAHWLVSAPERRVSPHFGLYDLALKRADAEEERASVLGILIERHMSVGNWKSTWEWHNWDQRGDAHGEGQRYTQVIHELERAGFAMNGRPTCLP